MKKSIIDVERTATVNGLGGPNISMEDQILQAVAEVPRTKYYGFPEMFGPGGQNISGDQIFRDSPIWTLNF